MTLNPLYSDPTLALYEIDDLTSQNTRNEDPSKREPHEPVRLLASTWQTRAITNDPLVMGIKYTDYLEQACATILKALNDLAMNGNGLVLQEKTAVVFNILRGGLNFGLRKALNMSLGFETHSSAFISAQRARSSDNPDEWYITENEYQKVFLPDCADIVFGDVVATGTSLKFALKNLVKQAQKQHKQIRSLLFFTIGGQASENILQEVGQLCQDLFPSFTRSTVVYLEGRFKIADANSDLSIKIPGTDLLRGESLLAPEFVNSNYDNPTYPLERCAIYDAGSRAFHVAEYLADVFGYWQQTLKLAKTGLSFEALLEERFGELNSGSFQNIDLVDLAQARTNKLQQALARLED